MISQWDKKSGSGWHDDYGANAQTPGEKQVFEEFLKTPKVRNNKPDIEKCFTNDSKSTLHSRPLRQNHGRIFKECKPLCPVPSPEGPTPLIQAVCPPIW